MYRIHTRARALVIVPALSICMLGAQMYGSASAFAGAYLTLNSFSGNPGATLQVTGGGWTPGDTVSLYVGNTSGSPVGSATVDSSSNFSASITVPANEPQGSLPIIGVDTTTNYQASNSYYVIPFAPTITTSAPSHTPGAIVTVTGSGYAPNETIALALGTGTGTATAGPTGSFTGTIKIPLTTAGLYHLTATGNASGAQSFDYFYVDTFYPSASPSTYYLMPGATLAFTGSGFAPGETITVTQSGTGTTVSTFTVGSDGTFKNAGGFAIPAASHGMSVTYNLVGTTSGGTASATVTIGDFYAYASPSSYFLYPGQSDSFTGGGFAGGETVDVFVSGSSTPLTSFTTDQAGSFTNAGSVLIPFGSKKLVTFNLVGRTSKATASASTGVGDYFASLSPSSYYVTPNTDITVSGSGYAPNEAIKLTVNGAVASSTNVTTTAMGTFKAPVRIPFGTGSATVGATGALSGAQASVSVGLATFNPSITPSLWYVFPGSKVSFTGTGFVPGETVTATLGAGSSTTAIADQFGGVSIPAAMVPYTATKSIQARVVGSLSQTAVTVSLAVGTPSPYLTSDVYSGVPGGTARVQGFSFAPGETVQVKAGSFASTTVADQSGTTAVVMVPLPYQAAQVPVTFTGSQSGISATLSISLSSYYANLSASTYYAQPGTAVTITGTGFAPNETVSVGTGVGTTTTTASTKGLISTSITLPFTQSASITVQARGATSGAQASLAIAFAPFLPQVSPSTYYALPGTTVTFTGTGFAPSESVAVSFNGSPVTSIPASATGSFSYSYEIPYGSSQAAVRFVGQKSGASVTDTISLASFSAFVSLSNYYGNGGSPVTVSGSGFASNEAVDLSFNGAVFATTQADSKGAIQYATAIPYSTAGTKPLSAMGKKSGVQAGTNFTVATVYPSFSLGSYAAAPGQSVTFIGSSFFPNETINITTDRTGSTPVATFTTDASGSFRNSSYILPSTFAEGTLVFTARGLHSLTPLSITYYVTGK